MLEITVGAVGDCAAPRPNCWPEAPRRQSSYLGTGTKIHQPSKKTSSEQLDRLWKMFRPSAKFWHERSVQPATEQRPDARIFVWLTTEPDLATIVQQES